MSRPRGRRSDTRREIAETIGVSLADRLMASFGGTDLYIPRKIADDHPICRALGREGADRLAAWGALSKISIPKISTTAEDAGRAMQAMRAARVMQSRRDGQTVSHIALTNNLTERHIYRILQRFGREAG